MMMERASSGVVRKGAWTEEEDHLLRKCIEKFGEGKWHQVPASAGLNRCRKSCRLRWLNYLKPNIKRGEFQEDEVDLILRLHKLLGNRWSLIAGRLPGRTANDLKNFWNTRLVKRGNASHKDMSHHHHQKHKPQNLVKVNVIKPRPRTFKSFAPTRLQTGEVAAATLMAMPPGCQLVLPRDEQSIRLQPPALLHRVAQPVPASLENGMNWWESLLSSSEKATSDQMGDSTATTSNSNTNSKNNLLSGDFWSQEMVDKGQQLSNGWNNEFFDDLALSWFEL